MPASQQQRLDALRRAADQAEKVLATAVHAACPGAHDPRKHRDYLPAWCDRCGRTARGIWIR